MPRRRFSNGAVDILKDIIETLDTESTTLEQSSLQVTIQYAQPCSRYPLGTISLLVPTQQNLETGSHPAQCTSLLQLSTITMNPHSSYPPSTQNPGSRCPPSTKNPHSRCPPSTKNPCYRYPPSTKNPCYRYPPSTKKNADSKQQITTKHKEQVVSYTLRHNFYIKRLRGKLFINSSSLPIFQLNLLLNLYYCFTFKTIKKIFEANFIMAFPYRFRDISLLLYREI